MIALPTLFLIFHTLIIFGVFPRNIVWGGRLTDATFLPLEILALVINLMLIITGCVATKVVSAKMAISFVARVKWFLFYFVVVNSVAAMFSTTTLEVLMTPVTILYAISLFRLIGFEDGL